MTSKITCIGLVLAFAAGSALATPRAFRSADGSKEIWGTIKDVTDSPKGKIVQLELDGSGKLIKFPASVLSEEDQSHIDEMSQVFAAGRSLRLEIKPNVEKSGPVERSGRKVSTANSAFDLGFRNGAQETLADIDVEYKIFYRKAVRKDKLGSERVDRSKVGELKLESIKPRGEQVLVTSAVPIVSDRANKGGPG